MKKEKKIAKFYNKNIKNKKIVKLNYSKGSVYHQYVIKVENKKLINLFKKIILNLDFIIQNL